MAATATDTESPIWRFTQATAAALGVPKLLTCTRHRWTCRSFRCSMCDDKSYIIRNNSDISLQLELYADHCSTVHANDLYKPFQCPTCAKVFAQRDLFMEHTLSHHLHGFWCRLCNFVAKALHDMIIHVQEDHADAISVNRVHTTNTFYSTMEHREFRLTKAYMDRREIPYPGECSARPTGVQASPGLHKSLIRRDDGRTVTSQFGKLRGEAHSGRRWICPECAKMVVSKDKLRSHRLTVHYRGYRCPNCSKVYCNARGLSFHLKSKTKPCRGLEPSTSSQVDFTASINKTKASVSPIENQHVPGPSSQSEFKPLLQDEEVKPVLNSSDLSGGPSECSKDVLASSNAPRMTSVCQHNVLDPSVASQNISLTWIKEELCPDDEAFDVYRGSCNEAGKSGLETTTGPKGEGHEVKAEDASFVEDAGLPAGQILLQAKSIVDEKTDVKMMNVAGAHV